MRLVGAGQLAPCFVSAILFVVVTYMGPYVQRLDISYNEWRHEKQEQLSQLFVPLPFRAPASFLRSSSATWTLAGSAGKGEAVGHCQFYCHTRKKKQPSATDQWATHLSS